ncbi:MAG: sodium:solute symporter [Thermoguttaceae bacterium]|nr:sodium:solute symporter [Thermoguttaceae bacterium]MDW8078559.1 sodium:solute symporter [Thermoguttaceae bacterium]
MLTGRILDYAVVCGYLVLVLGIGLRLGRNQKTAQAFLLGDRSLPWFAVLGSIVATETSSVTFLSVPGLSFAEGGSLLFLQLTLGYILGRLLVVALFLPQYFKGALYTAYQVLEYRFGGATKQVASASFLLMRNLADGLRLYLTAIVLQKLLGWDLIFSVLLMAVVTALYTYYGGLRSVVWNDCLQLVIYLLGAMAALIVIALEVGETTGSAGGLLTDGLAQIVQFGASTNRLQLFDFQLSLSRPYTLWSGIIGGIFVALATHGTDQLMVQRYLAARGLREAAKALAISGVVVAGQFALFLFLGVGLAAYYQLVEPGVRLSSPDQALAHFVVNGLPAGISGLVIAAVLAAAMSTLSSSLNASASAAVNDFYAVWLKQRGGEPGDLLIPSRLVTLACAIVQTAVALTGPFWAKTVIENVMAIATITSGVTLGIFLLAVTVPRATQSAALVGFVTGCAVDAAIVFGTAVAWPWYAVVGATTVLATGFLVDTVTRCRRKLT